MLVLSFGKSTSPKYREAVNTAGKFSGCKISDGRVCVSFPVKEVFEKWEYFNQLF